MRHDIQPYGRAFSFKEVAEEVRIATPTARKYNLEECRYGVSLFNTTSKHV